MNKHSRVLFDDMVARCRAGNVFLLQEGLWTVTVGYRYCTRAGVTNLMDRIAVLVAGSMPILHVPRAPLGLPRALPIPLPMPDAGLAPGMPDAP
jgi:hypothetical protein